ncbi:HD domain-containing protein [Peptostreptococcaceae bacterium AGR-M142]
MCIKLTDEVVFILNRLNKNNYDAGIVGGCVRDFFMKKKPKDWDITTSAKPDEIKELFKEYKQIDVGLKHGTVMIIINNEGFEITSFRIDGEYSDFRRPNSVEFTNDIIEDLKRRDFTQNAIFYSLKEGLIDPFNGVNDIKNKIIKSVLDPNKRFLEDPLRILRGIRFASNLGFEIERETKDAMIRYAYLLNKISKERIANEFLKTIKGRYAPKIINEYFDIIKIFIPEIVPMRNFNQMNKYHIYDIFDHTIETMKYSDDLIIKLTMFFHDIGKVKSFTIDENNIGHFYNHSEISFIIAKKIFKRLKLASSPLINNLELKNILELIKFHSLKINTNKKSIKKTISKLNGDLKQFERLLLVKKCDVCGKNPKIINLQMKELEELEQIFLQIKNEQPVFCVKDLDINGHNLINIGVKKGVIVGKILKKLQEEVLYDNLKNNKEVLLERSKEIHNCLKELK